MHGLKGTAFLVLLFALIAAAYLVGISCFRQPDAGRLGFFVAPAAAAPRPETGDVRYDPLKLPDSVTPRMVDLTVHDATRNRDIPIRVYLPASKAPAPVVLFSHGLGGSREGSAFMGRHWAARGYVAVFLQHPGSDTSVWKDARPFQRMAAMQGAASARNFLLRVKDVPAVLDELGRWNNSPNHPLAGRLDMKRIGMSGHSFGALTTQAVSGERASQGLRNLNFTDPRITAAVVFSPSAPKRGDPAQAFAGVRIPWLLMTGTKDVSPIGNTDVQSRLAVFPALPPGRKYELVLNGAEHSVFTDRALPGDREQRNPNHHRAILAIGTAFWDAWLKGDDAAKSWLQGSGPSTVLEQGDRWQTK